MESCNNPKSVKQIKIYFRFFKEATLCLDDSFAQSWHSINQHHRECFSNSLEGVSTNAEYLLAAFPSLYGPTQPKPSQLVLGRVIVEAKSSCVFGHCPVEKKDSPTERKPDGMAYHCRMQPCWLSVP